MVGRCDMCGEVTVLHLAGEFLICDECERQFRPEEDLEALLCKGEEE